MIEHRVIGNADKFTLAIGEYAFTPCESIPEQYLKRLISSNISDKDKEIIYDYLQKSKDK